VFLFLQLELQLCDIAKGKENVLMRLFIFHM
jgi:hypothetical protein